jgi:hypothetical protein
MTKPAPYPPTATQEIEAIDTFRSLIDHDRVILDIRQLDKVPNIDGDVDIINAEHRPIGKLEVQVKKLPDDYGSDPKLQIPLSLFGYAAKTTNNPVLLVGVDIDQKKAYWFHVPANANQRLGQETITVKFSLTQLIDGKDTRYINEWLGIAQDYQRKLREYDPLKEAYAKLSSAKIQVLSIAKSDLREIHGFLDEINSLLDGPFSIVKRRFYPNAWKVGLAYDDYATASIGYTLYPIPSDENDVLIKEVDHTLREEFVSLHGFTQHFKENPIKLRPREYAIELIDKRITRILAHRLLEHRGSEALAREYIFTFIDRFADQMGLEERESYSLAEIENGFYRHFPFWIYEAIRFLVRVERNRIKKPADCYYGKSYLDPSMLSSQIMPNEMNELKQSVINKVKDRDPVPIIRVGSGSYPFGLFAEFLSFLVSAGVTEIRRLYARPDYSLAPQGGSWWQFFSPEVLERNLKGLFDNLPAAYSAIVEQNLPQLKDHLLPFHGATKVIAVLDIRDERGSDAGVEFYYLKCEGELGVHIDLYRKDQHTNLFDKLGIKLGESVELDGKPYDLIGQASTVLGIIWVDFPILSFVYRELGKAFRRYFDKSGNGEPIW